LLDSAIPWHVVLLLTSASLQVNPITAAFFDTVLMYGIALNATLAEKANVKDGRALSRRLWGKTFFNGNTILPLIAVTQTFVLKALSFPSPGARRADG
jgi:hypothetical protein